MATVRELEAGDAPALTALYEDYEWWEDRDVEGVHEVLLETDLGVCIEDDGDLVAAARVLTDFRYYATVYDVVVAADRRGEGFGKQLMGALCDHEQLTEVPGVVLRCRDGLVPFYESVGFEVAEEAVEVPGGESEKLIQMVYRSDA